MAVFAAAGFSSCSQDEWTDGNTLPQGKYPLEIASVKLCVTSDEAQPWNAPQTRVSEREDGNSSVWDWNGTEQIGVQISDNENSGVYTLNTDQTLTATTPVYWENTNEKTITAWYPTDGTISLADQSKGLPYVLKGSGTGSYNTPAILSFTHKLAKIRVKLTGDKAGDVNEVRLKSYTSCTHTQGTVTASGAFEGEIVMCRFKADEPTFEANVVPGYAIQEIKVNGVAATQTTTVTPEAGKYHEITIEVEQKPTGTGYFPRFPEVPLRPSLSGTLTSSK